MKDTDGAIYGFLTLSYEGKNIIDVYTPGETITLHVRKDGKTLDMRYKVNKEFIKQSSYPLPKVFSTFKKRVI